MPLLPLLETQKMGQSGAQSVIVLVMDSAHTGVDSSLSVHSPACTICSIHGLRSETHTPPANEQLRRTTPSEEASQLQDKLANRLRLRMQIHVRHGNLYLSLPSS